ncbi:hypothetical protein AURDEDRAFT_172533 [Auricularia subglabra TFB-10046 SS5]|nr:hypothetical protein AURDEDRAFT_172533 [Auricularia subglabra TFB-10046 SS5]
MSYFQVGHPINTEYHGSLLVIREHRGGQIVHIRIIDYEQFDPSKREHEMQQDALCAFNFATLLLDVAVCL